MKTILMRSPEPGFEAPPARRRVYIHAGQLYVADEPTEITTILGSCVAVCLWDPYKRAGGMNHYLLPIPFSTPDISFNAMKFGESSIRKLIEVVIDLGCRKSALTAKVFGGASVARAMVGQGPGGQNVEVAIRCLEAEGIPVMAEDGGGTNGRKVIFHTDTGVAWVRQF